MSGSSAESADAPDSRRRHVPVQFKILLVGTACYIVYRIYQGISWLVHHL